MSDGGSVEKTISSDHVSRRCVKGWINTEHFPDPSLWDDKLRRIVRNLIEEPEICVWMYNRDYEFNGYHLLWTSILVPNASSKDDLIYDRSYNKYVRFTDSTAADSAPLIRFHIQLPKNSIKNVHIVVKYRARELPDVTAIRRWMEKFPLGLTEWSLLKNSRTTLLRVCGIDSTLSVDYIRKKIQNHSSEHFHVESVTVNNKSNRKRFDSDGIQDRIYNLLRADIEPDVRFVVHVEAKKSDTNILGTIDTSRSRMCELRKAISRLEYGGEKVCVVERLIDVINVRSSIFDAVAPTIKKILKSDPNVTANKKSLEADYVSLQLSAKAVNGLQSMADKTRSKITELTNGMQWQFNDQSILQSAKGLRLLSATCAKYATAVELGDRTATLYGSQAASAVQDIQQYHLQKESDRKWKVLYVSDFVPSMKTSTKIAIIIKTFVKREKKKHFINMTNNYDSLIVATGVTDLFIDLQLSTIKCKGSDASVDQLQSLVVDRLLEHQHNMLTVSKTKFGPFNSECVSCFMPVMHSLCHNLRKCGHLYCHECLLMQMEVTARSRSFPLVCAAEQCNSLLSWSDVEDVYCDDTSGQDKLIKSALENFVINKPSEGFFCMQADCPGLLLRCFVDLVTTKKTSCAKCGTSYCIMCKVPFHEGQTCSEYKLTKVNIEHRLQQWINANKANRKLCPYCDSGIEKNGGCNVVYCTHCKMQICWTCLDVFIESADMDLHLHEKHNESH